MPAVSVEKLRQVVDKALENDAYAERLFNDPDGISKEYALTDDEALVVRQMTREQFNLARKDAAEVRNAELSEKELENVAGGLMTYSALGPTTDMIVGRSIICAGGGTLGDFISAGCDCCKWKGGSIMTSITNPAY
jgi:hypothetical protein